MHARRTISLFVLLFFCLSGQAVSENAFGQVIVTGEPRGSQVLEHGDMFEVGMKMKADTSVHYVFRADSFVYFDIHSHDGNEVTTHSVIESDVFEGTFVAPRDGNYYFLAMNLGESEVALAYDISFAENKHPIVHDGIGYDVITSSNSNIDFLGFSQEDKQILILMETPYLTPGFVNVSVPRTLMDGPFDLSGNIREYNHTQNESVSTFVIKTNTGTNDISITGTTVVPEFPVPMVFLALIVSFLLITRLKLQNFHLGS